MGVFCQGLGQVIEAASAAPTPASTSQGEKDALLTLADTTQQAFATTAQKLTQLGPPGITAGKQAQDNAVGFFTTAAQRGRRPACEAGCVGPTRSELRAEKG
jgi:hypothetical protein